MSKYYLWDWHSSRTIAYRDGWFHDDECAKKQDAFRSFDAAKKRGIAVLKEEIEQLKNELADLRKLTKNDVNPKKVSNE